MTLAEPSPSSSLASSAGTDWATSCSVRRVYERLKLAVFSNLPAHSELDGRGMQAGFDVAAE
jgi:hypothetical protein